MTAEQRKVLTDAMDKQENSLVDLCVNKTSINDEDKLRDAIIFLSRECRLVAIEVLNLSEKNKELLKRIEDLETEMGLLVRG